MAYYDISLEIEIWLSVRFNISEWCFLMTADIGSDFPTWSTSATASHRGWVGQGARNVQGWKHIKESYTKFIPQHLWIQIGLPVSWSDYMIHAAIPYMYITKKVTSFIIRLKIPFKIIRFFTILPLWFHEG